MGEWLKNFANDYVVKFVIDLVLAILILVVGFALVKALQKAMKKSKLFVKADLNAQAFLMNFIGGTLKVFIVLTAVIVLGVLGGIGMSQLISKFMDTPTALSVPAILVAVVFSVLIGLIFGLVPAVKASKLNPIEALRRE